jgi:hypothetical protein
VQQEREADHHGAGQERVAAAAGVPPVDHENLLPDSLGPVQQADFS